MLFNLSNALVSFPGYIHILLTKKLNIFVIVYLDKILIYINEANHIDFIWWVFEQLRKYLLYINIKKYRFYQNEMQFFGYIVSLQKIYIKDE